MTAHRENASVSSMNTNGSNNDVESPTLRKEVVLTVILKIISMYPCIVNRKQRVDSSSDIKDNTNSEFFTSYAKIVFFSIMLMAIPTFGSLTDTDSKYF